MALARAYKQMRYDAAPRSLRSCDLVTKLRRIRWELSIAMDRTADGEIARAMALLVRQTEEAIGRIEASHD